VDAHQPLVQLLVDRITVDGRFERGDGLVRGLGLQDFGDPGVRV
jgi:hypothetical protein